MVIALAPEHSPGQALVAYQSRTNQPKTVGAIAGTVFMSDYSKTRTSVKFRTIAPQASTKLGKQPQLGCSTTVPPNLPLSDWQILDMSGIVGSRDHTCLRIHSVINNRTGQRSLFVAHEGGLSEI